MSRRRTRAQAAVRARRDTPVPQADLRQSVVVIDHAEMLDRMRAFIEEDPYAGLSAEGMLQILRDSLTLYSPADWLPDMDEEEAE